MLENVIRLFAPHICLGCGVEEDSLLCAGCRQAIVPIPSRCYMCAAATKDYKVCRACASKTPLQYVLVCAEYEGLAKALVRRTKYDRARAGIREMAELLLENESLRALAEDIVIAPAPTATSRVRTRGYDQAVLLSALLAQGLYYSNRRVLTRIGQAHQVGANRSERQRQLQHAFRVVRPDLVKGQQIVLVDDVLTTGATLEAAARVLLEAGAVRVGAVVFAQA